jgi:N utilization substance protein B
MLNRRILRVKAMQALYSYFTAQESLKVVIRERMESQFYPDPAKDDFSESEQFAIRRKSASKLFDEALEPGIAQNPDPSDPEIVSAVEAAISSYQNELKNEERRIKSSMLKDIDDIYKLYLKLIQLPVELSHLEKLEKEKREKAHIPKESKWKWRLIDNPVIDELTKVEALNKALIDHKISWSNELDTLKIWYKEVLKEDEVIISYQQADTLSKEDHHEILLHLYKKIIFKNESINESLAQMDLHWSENKPILKSLVVKTFKDYEPDLDPPFELKEVSKNQEEDLSFFTVLYDESIKKSKDLDDLITKKVKNWDIKRVATLDRIILKMALSEMMQFHAIPVKVTINEFIEISKQYSTPKSKQFINGILDVMANELTSDGVIRKSGRGLIDNK